MQDVLEYFFISSVNICADHDVQVYRSRVQILNFMLFAASMITSGTIGWQKIHKIEEKFKLCFQ